MILDSASLVNAAITDQNGQIQVSHYDEDGSLVGPEPVYWRAQSFPAAGSFTDDTVCPNNHTYKINVRNGATIAQMMKAQNPPTKWAPVDTQGASRTGRSERSHPHEDQRRSPGRSRGSRHRSGR